MKTSKDPRHLNRIKLMKLLFSWNFLPDKKPDQKIQKIVSHLAKIDKLIATSAPGRPMEQINKIDLAILRLATFELIIKKGVPLKVVVDEAIELSKQYGSESSPAFINGALGQLIKIKKITV